MKCTILTLFPEAFDSPFSYSIIKRAIDKKRIAIKLVNIRDFGIGAHKLVDDRPYGGGVGMIMRVDVVHRAIQHARCKNRCREKVVLMDARGETFIQKKARELATLQHLILVAGHYEGIDDRITHFVDERISIGNYILSGGELPAMVIVDALVRLTKGVLKKEATEKESFCDESLLEHPQYTRPRTYRGLLVPTVLLLGNHEKIQQWRTDTSGRK